MSQKKRSKARDQLAHARRRARERAQFEGSTADIERFLKALVVKIHDGSVKCLEKQSNRLSVFAIEFGDKTVYPVYDQSRKMIVTFLSKEMVLERKMGE